MAASNQSLTPPPASNPVSLTERNFVTGINIALSVLGVWGNITVVILICTNAQLRRHCKYLQAALAIGDSVLCLGQASNASVNMYVVNVAPKIVRWQCLIMSTHAVWATIYSLIMTVCIAFDRWVAVTYTTWYRSMRKLCVCLYCAGGSLVISGGLIVASYTDVDLYDYPAGCIGSASRSPMMSLLINYVNIAAGVIVLLVYPCVLATIMIKKHRMHASDQHARDQIKVQHFMRQVQVTRAVTCVIVASLLLYVIPNLMVVICSASGVPSDAIFRAQAYIGLGTSVHSGLNCVFYLWKDGKMRKAFVKLYSGCLPKKFTPNQVTPAILFSGTS